MNNPKDDNVGAEPTNNLHTPVPVQDRVIQRYVAGESQREIARNESLDRATVSRILSLREVFEHHALHESRLLAASDRAMQTMENLMRDPDSRVALAASAKVLDSIANLKANLSRKDQDEVRYVNAMTPGLRKPRKKRPLEPAKLPGS